MTDGGELALAKTRTAKRLVLQDKGAASAKAWWREGAALGPAQAAWAEPDECEPEPAGS